MRQLKVGSFDGVSLSTTFQTKVDVNPSDISADVRKLADWYVSTGGNNVKSLSNQGRGSMGGGGENYRGRKYLDEINQEGLGRGAKADFVDVRCVPVYMKQDAQWYDACPTCNKKVTAEGAQGDRFRCEKCDATVVPSQRYLISIQVTDNVSLAWLTLFNEAGVEFFGMPAAELKQRMAEDPVYLTKLAQSRMNRPVLMRLRVKEDLNPNAMPGDEGADRLRLSAVRLTEFMPLQGASEETRRTLAQNLRTECDDLLSCIEAY
ncbi:replication factor A1 [Strigomonas culicis]|uniref:Replication factor A1 n=1 Tax=Strigomonas culicis TaxID=28005 RepID=S9UZQ5_9TRYP|nr:replication factor A1 [Strigomonas culicis]EPY34239.1 replication factor A1 [Strigomonas culicis]|eukprot:EPY28166.1 replication factor A1 [Strigomonas culicis]